VAVEASVHEREGAIFVMIVNQRDRLRADLIQLLVESVPDIDGRIGENEPLLSSGRVNSLTLFKLAVWVEEHSQGSLDFTAINIAESWNSIAAILDFVEKAEGA
jgi:hypothetical protein